MFSGIHQKTVMSDILCASTIFLSIFTEDDATVPMGANRISSEGGRQRICLETYIHAKFIEED
jgi:hypothetical protein